MGAAQDSSGSRREGWDGRHEGGAVFSDLHAEENKANVTCIYNTLGPMTKIDPIYYGQGGNIRGPLQN